MRTTRRLTLGALLLATLAACNAGGGSTQAPSTAPSAAASAAKPTIKIGSVGFDEARVMAEIYAQVLEANGYTVDRAGIGLGARPVVAPAIESGQIDLQPEYIGSRIGYYGGTSTSDAAANLAALQPLANAKGLTVLNYTPAVDTNAFVVRPETATALGIAKMSDVAAVQDQLMWGLPTDCPTNPLCGAPGGALQGTYGITAATVAGATLLSACDTPMADALKNKTIDVAELCSTSPEIIVNGWVVLADDKATQPADNVSPIVRDDYLAKVDKTAFEKILNDVSAKIDTATLADLYKQVAVDHKDAKDVAGTWLKANGFVQ